MPLAQVIPHIDWHGRSHMTICMITADYDLAWVQAFWHATPAQSERLAVLLTAQGGAPPAVIQALHQAYVTTTVVEV